MDVIQPIHLFAYESPLGQDLTIDRRFHTLAPLVRLFAHLIAHRSITRTLDTPNHPVIMPQDVCEMLESL